MRKTDGQTSSVREGQSVRNTEGQTERKTPEISILFYSWTGVIASWTKSVISCLCYVVNERFSVSFWFVGITVVSGMTKYNQCLVAVFGTFDNIFKNL